MAIFFDVLLVALLVFSCVRHFRLGLACSVLSAGRLVFSLIIASLLCRPVGMLIFNLGVPEFFSGIVAFVLLFVAVMIASSFIIGLLSKIKIPIITKFDKLLGLVLGIILGMLTVSVISTALYSVLELLVLFDAESTAMSVYEESYVFKFIYDLKLFDFIRNLF